MGEFSRQEVFWFVAVALVFPLLTILLGEVVARLERRRSQLAGPFAGVRLLILPLLAVHFFATRVADLDPDSIFSRTVLTLFWVAVIHTLFGLLNAVFFSDSEDADSWRTKVPKLFRDVVRVVVLIIGASIVTSTVWGANLGGLVAALGVGSVVLGFALQETLGNVMSGIALLFERPFRVGDWIKVGDHIGRVTEVNWRAIRLRTRKNEELVVPNSVLGREIITNFDMPTAPFAEQIFLGFSYDDPPNFVKSALLKAAARTPGIANDPPVQVQTISYDDFAITYRIRIAVGSYENLMEVRDQFMSRVWYVAKRYGLSIPFPIRTIQIDRSSKAAGDVDMEDLRAFANASTVDEDALATLAEKSQIRSFGKGETVLELGEISRFFYIVLTGKAELSKGESLAPVPIVNCGHGEFVGESALIGNGQTQARVKALDDLELIAINPATMHDTLGRHMQFAHEIDRALDQRRALMEEELGTLRHSQSRETSESGEERILAGIRDFLRADGVSS